MKEALVIDLSLSKSDDATVMTIPTAMYGVSQNSSVAGTRPVHIWDGSFPGVALQLYRKNAR